MNLRAFNHTVNLVGFQKNNQNYVATYAWMMQCGYEEIMGLFGSQSVTAHAIKVGDIVGVNACSKSMKAIASQIGESHSNEKDKLNGVTYSVEDGAILFPQSKVSMVCEVKEIYHLPGIEEDFLVYLKVIKVTENSSADFLLMSDMD
jgi:flavin reductase (DIM6/NTAB) family NADH-FMN oxidoreductase RutF